MNLTTNAVLKRLKAKLSLQIEELLNQWVWRKLKIQKAKLVLEGLKK